MNESLRKLTLALALVSLSSTAGCKKSAEKIAAALMDAGAGAQADAGGAAAEEQHDETLDGLVECLNGLDHSIARSLDRYQSWLPPVGKDGKQPGPTGKERNVYGIFDVSDSDVTSCNKTLAVAVTTPEFKDVATKYKANVDKLVPQINAAHNYYDHGDYKDDKFAKGKTMHAALWPLAEEFLTVSKPFRAAVVKANDARMDAQIKQVEKEQGRNLFFHKLNLMRYAKAALPVSTSDAPALADLEAATTAYESAYNECTTYATAHKNEADKVLLWSTFAGTAEDYLKALKERVRRVRDKKAYDSSEKFRMNGPSAYTVDGSPDKVSHEYNDLVSRANSLHWR
jgi:hypothetical protein